MKITLAQLNPTIGDFSGNERKIVQAIEAAKNSGSDLILFSELVICGYPPEDLLLHRDFIEQAEKTLNNILPSTKGIVAIIGLPRRNNDKGEKPLHNSAALIKDGKLIGYQDKMLLPTYDVFDEKRYFESGSEFKIYEIFGKKVAITICEDLWHHSELVNETRYQIDPVTLIKELKADLVLNLSASPYNQQKYNARLKVVQKAAKTLNAPLILVNQVGGNDSILFDGNSLVVDQNGELVTRLPGFQEAIETIEDFIPKNIPSVDPIEDLYQALVMGVRDYFYKSGFKKACLGLSGGIDSAVVAAIAVQALGSENVIGVSMPSRYSSQGSKKDAQDLASALGIELKTIPIEKPYQAFLDLLTPSFENKAPDVTEENLQARMRGVILMALSNKFGYIVLSTGNKSELAMGYSTLYGDLTGGLSVIADVSKAKVYELARFINRDKILIPASTIEKPPSAELRPNQKDSDSLPPYPIIDQVLEAYVERNETPADIAKNSNIDIAVVKSIIDRIYNAEYKRRQAPPGLRVSSKSFSVGRKFPIVQRFKN
jgi:NAD+ synthase (glutamine-hydrolysing)